MKGATWKSERASDALVSCLRGLRSWRPNKLCVGPEIDQTLKCQTFLSKELFFYLVVGRLILHLMVASLALKFAGFWPVIEHLTFTCTALFLEWKLRAIFFCHGDFKRMKHTV